MSTSVQQAVVLAACLALLLVLAWVDVITRESPDIFVFQFVPLALGTWFAGLGGGLFLSAAAGGLWLAADVAALEEVVWTTELWNTLSRLTALILLALGLSRIRRDYDRQRRLNAELTEALAEIKQLRGILPMCSFCRRIRNQEGDWVPVEVYIHDHSDARISHGLCPRCYRKHYGAPDGT